MTSEFAATSPIAPVLQERKAQPRSAVAILVTALLGAGGCTTDEADDVDTEASGLTDGATDTDGAGEVLLEQEPAGSCSAGVCCSGVEQGTLKLHLSGCEPGREGECEGYWLDCGAGCWTGDETCTVYVVGGSSGCCGGAS